LGHKTIEMTGRYAHLSPSHLEKAIDIISFTGNQNSFTESANEKEEPPYFRHQNPEDQKNASISII
jgi:hypothetical protein